MFCLHLFFLCGHQLFIESHRPKFELFSNVSISMSTGGKTIQIEPNCASWLQLRSSVQPNENIHQGGYSQSNIYNNRQPIASDTTREDPAIYPGSPATQVCSVLHHQQLTSAGDPGRPIAAFLARKRPSLEEDAFFGDGGKRSPRLAALSATLVRYYRF